MARTLQETMSTSDNTQQTDQEVQELTDENLVEVSGGACVAAPYILQVGSPSTDPALDANVGVRREFS